MKHLKLLKFPDVNIDDRTMRHFKKMLNSDYSEYHVHEILNLIIEHYEDFEDHDCEVITLMAKSLNAYVYKYGDLSSE
jgi:uncharacterized HAD superfamily protein